MPMNTLKLIIDANRNTVLVLFKHRCAVNPAHIATVIHEIEPRSMRPTDWWELENMIPLCTSCHGMIHREGTKKWRPKLRSLRESVS